MENGKTRIYLSLVHKTTTTENSMRVKRRWHRAAAGVTLTCKQTNTHSHQPEMTFCFVAENNYLSLNQKVRELREGFTSKYSFFKCLYIFQVLQRLKAVHLLQESYIENMFWTTISTYGAGPLAWKPPQHPTPVVQSHQMVILGFEVTLKGLEFFIDVTACIWKTRKTKQKDRRWGFLVCLF